MHQFIHVDVFKGVCDTSLQANWACGINCISYEDKAWDIFLIALSSSLDPEGVVKKQPEMFDKIRCCIIWSDEYAAKVYKKIECRGIYRRKNLKDSEF